jgi:hypothetical protein
MQQYLMLLSLLLLYMQEVGSDDEDSTTVNSDAPQTVEHELSSLVETVFDGGLSAALVSTLRVVVAKVPGLQAQVQSSLLKQVARALRQFTTEPLTASTSAAASSTTTAAAGAAAATAGHTTAAVQQRPRVGSFHQLTALDSPRIKRQPFAAAAATPGGSESSGGGGGGSASASSSKPADKSWTSFLFQQHTHASTAEVVVDDEPESSEVSATTSSVSVLAR